MTDDLAMQALSGTPAERATAALAAGCDVALYCAGDLAPTAAPAGRLPAADPASAGTAARPHARWPRGAACHWTATALAAERDRLLAS